MGNQYCLRYQDEQLTDVNKGQLSIVENSPSTKYAVRMKNNFPSLPNHIESVLQKHQNIQIQNIVKQFPIFYILQKSVLYQGHWKKGLPHGYGKIFYSDFSYYEGLIISGQPNTGNDPKEVALYIFKDGSSYLGNFKDSKFEGKGKFITKNNQIQFIGQFKNGLPHGNILEKYFEKNEIYEGQYVNGIKDGKGRYYIDDKLVYKGLFSKGTFHGEGVLTELDGTLFSGNFQNGRKIDGRFESTLGIRGNVEKSQLKGQGFYQWKDGKFYIGAFKNDKFHGLGKIYFPNGAIVSGSWKKGHNISVSKQEQKTLKEIQQIRDKYRKRQNEKFQYSDQDLKSLQTNSLEDKEIRTNTKRYNKEIHRNDKNKHNYDTQSQGISQEGKKLKSLKYLEQ